MQATAAVPMTVSVPRVNKFMAQVYLLMAVGLALTGWVASLVSQNQALMLRIAFRPGTAFILFIIQIMIVVALSRVAMKLSPAAAVLLFLAYAAVTGLTLSVLFLYYAQAQIFQVFWLTAGTFFLTSLFGLLFKKDMSSAGNVLFMLLLGWMIAWFFSWFFPNTSFNWMMTYLGIALFVGLTAWDTQRLKQIANQMDSHPARGGLIVIGALTLYLDFINLFLLILRASNRR